ncbi:MAG: hypothetical protein AUG51_19580 [Acidobacteria bacterium 13_1_20CM_3_53_8]|nr:MAG: hypothetical protein AUG51_19580 [Acidobacteria bacterium 13_1_20CM_3_53_8]
MKKIRRTKVVIETERIICVSQRRTAMDVWCDECGQHANMLSLEEAVAVTGLSPQEICRKVGADALHFRERADGLLFICLNSLLE